MLNGHKHGVASVSNFAEVSKEWAACLEPLRADEEVFRLDGLMVHVSAVGVKDAN